MTQLECHDRLTKVFREVFDDPSLVIKDEYTANDIPGWDSVTHVNLIVSVEEEFGISFSTAEIASLGSIGEFREVILARTAH